MGKFNTLKYFEDDLVKEINYPISSPQKDLWVENTRLVENGITIEERDDFYNTMVLGEVPQYTCLSYINGAYKDCLLSCFDSNKKFLYASLSGKVVGRAILRLTKGGFIDPSDNRNPSLSFVDLENMPDGKERNNTQNSGEFLTLFLELPYIAHVSPNAENQIKKLFIQAAEAKSKQLGAVLVLSNNYSGMTEQGEYTRTKFYLYISKSKGGSQYFDSLDGDAYASDEGSYRSNSFYVRQDVVVAN